MEGGRARFRERAVAAAVLAALALVVYAGTLGGDFLNWDDESYVVRNPELREPLPGAVATIFTTFRCSNYNPLQRLVYLVDFQVFGADPLPFRLTGLVLHVAAAFLLYLVLAEETPRHGWLRPRRPFFGSGGL